MKTKLKVLDKQRLSAVYPDKTVYHIALDSSGLEYLPGDILKICPENDPHLILSMQKMYGEEFVPDILHELDLRVASDTLMQHLSHIDKSLQKILNPMYFVQYRKHILGHTVPELIQKHGDVPLDTLTTLLSPIRPRSYSIASSMAKHPNEIHLTIGLNQFQTDKGIEKGTASGYIVDRLNIGDEVYGFLKNNPRFRLPDRDTDIIMIGPGTGIAPFIGFMQEREHQKGRGRNWLIFGERTREDFFYKSFLTKLVSENKLKLDLAFSREQEEKLYVQHLIQEQKEEFKRWIDNGAYIYICGDKNMAKDVEEVILSLLSTDRTKAEQQLTELKEQKRYLLDVY